MREVGEMSVGITQVGRSTQKLDALSVRARHADARWRDHAHGRHPDRVGASAHHLLLIAEERVTAERGGGRCEVVVKGRVGGLAFRSAVGPS